MTHTTTARTTEPLIGRRVEPRIRCEIVVGIKDGGAAWGQALLCDISATGFRLASLSFAPAGHSLWLRLEGMDPLPAKIRWKSDASAGCEFLYPLGAETLSEIREFASSTQRLEHPQTRHFEIRHDLCV